MKWRFWLHLSLAMTGLLWLGHFSTLGATADKEAHQASAGEVLNFALIDHHGRLHELRRAGGKAVVLFFTANDCPVARQSASKIKALRDKFAERGVSVFMVNSSLSDDRDSIATATSPGAASSTASRERPSN